jgi:hypothetical protein
MTGKMATMPVNAPEGRRKNPGGIREHAGKTDDADDER